MSVDGGGPIRLFYGDQQYAFALGLDQWRAIQDKTDCGPGEIYRRLFLVASALEGGMSLGDAAAAGLIGDWRVDDVRETVVQGLIGGDDLSALQANVLVRKHFDDTRNFKAHIALAFKIAQHGLKDFEDAPPGELKGEGAGPSSPAEKSGGAASTSTRSGRARSRRASSAG